MDEHNTDLADISDGHAERFVPELMGGLLIDAEHRGRYWWAAALVADKRVLDAPCGTGYGANILARSGATDVVGVDRAEHVIDAACQQAEPRVRFEVADLLELPFPDHSFDVVVCFEGIEHVEMPERVFDELARVLSAGGVLAVSSPNRNVYIHGNPHHHHEYTPDELESELRARFEHVRLVRQHDWVAAAILEDAIFEAGDGTSIDTAGVRKIAAVDPGAETYTLALASNASLPTPRPVVVLTQDVEIARLIEQVAALSRENEERQRHSEELQREIEERQRESEERHRVIEHLEAEARRAQAAAHEAHEQIEAIMRTRTFRYGSAIGTTYTRLRRLTRRA